MADLNSEQQQTTFDEKQSMEKYETSTVRANLSECKSSPPLPSSLSVLQSQSPPPPPPLSNDEFQKVNIFEQLPCQATPTPTPSIAMVYMKIRLRESDDLLLFENNSYTMVRDSSAATAAAAATANTNAETVNASLQRDDDDDNDDKRRQQWRRRLRPIQFMMDNDKHRGRTNNVETQTVDAHYKTRAINTNHIEKSMAGTFVSNYDMHDTYVNLGRTTQCIQIEYDDRHEQLDITTYTRDDGSCYDLTEELERSKSFQLSSMILQRVLAGNIFYAYQRRFRNMQTPKSLEPVVNYLYRLHFLYRYRCHETAGSSVSCMSWCPTNTDILAIGYGVFKCEACKRKRGAVCLWNIKNPVNPERYFEYEIPVTAVSFSMGNSQLLAIGFYDGSIRIIDITIADGSNLVAISERKTSPPIEPVWQMKWIKIRNSVEELLTISQDGFVMLYTITNSALLIGSRQLQIFLNECNIQIPANRFAPLLTIEMHPIKSSLYYVGTADGIIHECSIYDSFQHKSFKKVHKYGVYSMEFSPWCPKIYLTCGFDWYVRIWIEDIDEPIIELRNSFEPIKCASWCPTNSTIIACTTASSLNIWDLRTNCLLPAAVHRFDKTINSSNVGGVGHDGSGSRGSSSRNSSNSNTNYFTETDLTICYFTNCGRSIVVGTNDGTAFVFALEDMPFSPHRQYDALEEAIMQSLVSKPELKRKIKQLGFLGY